MSSVKIANTEMLLKLAETAEKINRNRQVDTRRLTSIIDKDGIHLSWFNMVHNDMEIRTAWFVKIENTLEPLEIWLDISFGDFESLPDYTYEPKDIPDYDEHLTIKSTLPGHEVF